MRGLVNIRGLRLWASLLDGLGLSSGRGGDVLLGGVWVEDGVVLRVDLGETAYLEVIEQLGIA
jgi:hypothetical protein